MYSAGYAPTASRDQSLTLFGQTMWYVAFTAGFFAFGCYLSRNLSPGFALFGLLAGFGCLFGMNFARRGSAGLTIALLFGVGLFLGIAMGPGVSYYANADPQAVWQAAGATGLFIAGFGTAGYVTRRDLSLLGRVSWFALLALILFGLILLFVRIPGGDLIYAILGLVIFAGLTMFDFQRLRRTSDRAAAPFLAASIFLDGLNVFLFFLRIFSGRN